MLSIAPAGSQIYPPRTILPLATAAASPNWFGSVQDGGGPLVTAANSAFGWTVAKTSTATPYYRGRIGATGAVANSSSTNYLSGSSGPAKGTGSATTTAGDSFVAPADSGTFESGTWTLSFTMRAGTAGAVGRIRCSVWRSTNADGTSATNIVSDLIGSTITLSTTVDNTSTITFNPGSFALNNEYLFFQAQWEETTTGSATSANVFFRIGPSSFVTAPWHDAISIIPTATNLVAASPFLDTPTAGQNSNAAVGIVDSSPTLGVPSLGQAHVLSPTGIVDSSPTIGTASGGYNITATGLVDSPPAIGVPTLGQVVVLSGTGIVDSSPTLGSATYIPNIAVAGLAASSPTIGAPTLGQVHAAAATGLASSSPTIGAPTLGQVHALAPVGVVTASPHLGADRTVQTSNALPYTSTDSPGIRCSSNGAHIIALMEYATPTKLSSDYGATWTNSTTFDGSVIALGTGAITCEMSYAGDKAIAVHAAASGAWVWTSTDYGDHWTQVAASNMPSGYNYRVGISGDGTMLVAATSDEGAGHGFVYISTDGGTTWTQKNPAGTDTSYYNTALSNDGQYIYVPGSGTTVWRSDDYGATWTSLTGISVYGGIVRVSANGAHVLTSAIAFSAFWISHDHGASFSAVSWPAAGPTDLFLSDDGQIIAYTTGSDPGVYGSSDGLATITSYDALGSTPYTNICGARDGSILYGSTHNPDTTPSFFKIADVPGPTLAVLTGPISILVGSPTIGQPTLGQAHALAPTGIAVAGPALGTATYIPNVGVVGLATGAPTVGVPALGQGHSLSATGLVDSGPAIGTPTYIPNIAPTPLAVASPTLGVPALGQVGGLTATGITVGSPTIGVPTLAQVHSLAAAALVVASPTLGQPTMSQSGVMAPVGIVDSSPTFDAPAISQAHVLAAVGFADSSPAIGIPGYGVVFAAPSLVTSSPVLGAPTLGQVHGITAVGLVVGSPIPGQPTLSQTGVMAPIPLIVGSPFLGAPALAQVQVLNPIGLSDSSPAIGVPGYGVVFGTPGLVDSSPAIGSPGFGRNLAALAVLAAGSPSIGVPSLGQSHSLAAQSLASGPPTLGAAAYIPNVSTGGLVIVSPTIGVGFLAQVHILAAPIGIATASPAIGVPIFSQSGIVIPFPIAVGSPTIGQADFAQTHALGVAAYAVASPVLGPATVAQVQAITSLGVTVGSPVFGAPQYVPNLVATGIATAAPAIGVPTLTASANLSAVGIATGSPAITVPPLGQLHQLGAIGVVDSRPAIGGPSPAQSQAFSAVEIAVHPPAIGQPFSGQMSAYDLVVGHPMLGAPAFVAFDRRHVTGRVTASRQRHEVTGQRRSNAARGQRPDAPELEGTADIEWIPK